MAGVPERLPGENELNYHKRLIYGKAVDKTLADIDYSELAPAIYGESYSSETTRKMLYGSVKTLQVLERSMDDLRESDELAALESKRLEIQKERQRFFDQRREYKKLVTADSRFEHLTECIEEAVRKLPTLQINRPRADPYEGPIGGASEAVLVLADWHYGMQTDNIFNTFNREVFRKRFNTLEDVVSYKLRRYDVSKLHILLLGDMIHGGIHVNARVASDELVCDQLIQVSEYLAELISVVSACAGETYVYSTYGNHARVTAAKEEAIQRDNLERIIPWWLEQRLMDFPDVTVMEDSGTEFICLNVCGNNIVATHGDLDDVRSSSRLINTIFSKAQKKSVDYVLMGHRHHHESFDDLGISTIGCGSLCGTDEYANSKRLYSKPEQLLLVFDANNSCLDAEYHIDLSRGYDF